MVRRSSVSPCESLQSCKVELRKRLLPHAHALDCTSYGELYQQHKKQVYDMIVRTVEVGESNSTLILGPHGCGKSRLVAEVLCELSSLKSFSKNAVAVHLNGLLHTDDKLALQDITRQLNLDNVIGDKVLGTVAETLSFVLTALRSGTSSSSKSVIFILDEFQMFTNHKNQSLLYNLFDVAQSKQAPISVIGLSTNLDVVEDLEKRVKSRFSRRQLFLTPQLSKKEYCELFTSLLSLPSSFVDAAFRKSWNSQISALSESSDVKKLLENIYYHSREIRFLKNILFLVVSDLGEDKTCVTYDDVRAAFNSQNADTKLQLMLGLSVLQLSLMIAMKHLAMIYDGDAANFQLVYRQYEKFTQTKASLQGFPRNVAMKAFEELEDLELIQTVDHSHGTSKEFQLYRMTVMEEQVLEAVNNYPGLPTEVSQWYHTSLV